MRRSVTAAAWVALGNYANIGMSFLVFVALARFLSPSDFGLVAVASAFLDILLVIARGGLPDVVIRKHQLSEEFADTAFWVSTASGIVYCIIFIAFARPIARLFAMPDLQEVLIAISLMFIIGGLGAIYEGRLQRTFGFKTLSIRGMVANLISGVFALWLAYAGYGVWKFRRPAPAGFGGHPCDYSCRISLDSKISFQFSLCEGAIGLRIENVWHRFGNVGCH